MTSEEDQAVIDAMLDQLEDVAVPESLHPDAVRKRLLLWSRQRALRLRMSPVRASLCEWSVARGLRIVRPLSLAAARGFPAAF